MESSILSAHACRSMQYNASSLIRRTSAVRYFQEFLVAGYIWCKSSWSLSISNLRMNYSNLIYGWNIEGLCHYGVHILRPCKPPVGFPRSRYQPREWSLKTLFIHLHDLHQSWVWSQQLMYHWCEMWKGSSSRRCGLFSWWALNIFSSATKWENSFRKCVNR